MVTRILGISAFYHDSAAALVEDGQIVAAAQEERFTRKKYDDGFPQPCHRILPRAQAGVAAARPRLRRVLRQAVPQVRAAARDLSRLCAARVSVLPQGDAAWLGEKLFQKTICATNCSELDADFDGDKLLFTEHHQATPRSAFYPSPFDEAAGADHGRGRRVGHDLGGARRGQHARDRQGDPFSALARPALFGLHLLHRLQGQFRRIQADGARALRRAAATRN